MILSVIIPVRNGASTLTACLRSIVNQTIKDKLEIIILDTNSTDNSRSIAEKFNCRVVSINPSEFNHGATRNMAVNLAKGDLVYFTVQDARLANNKMLEEMTFHFNDNVVSGVVGMQAVPHEIDKNPARWFYRATLPKVEVRWFPHNSFGLLNKDEQFKLSNWDDVNAMYRKVDLIKLPFRNTMFSEDWLWARDALSAGYKILRDPSLVVYHYHHMTFSYSFREKYIVNYQFFINFKISPSVPLSLVKILKSSYALVKRNELSIFEKLKWILHNIKADLAVFLSIFLFRSFLSFGRKSLDFSYQLFCQKIPQGKQNR